MFGNWALSTLSSAQPLPDLLIFCTSHFALLSVRFLRMNIYSDVRLEVGTEGGLTLCTGFFVG